MIFRIFPPFFAGANVIADIKVDIVGFLGTRNRLALLFIGSLPSINYESLAKSNDESNDESKASNTIITNSPLTKTLTRLEPLIYTTKGYSFERTITYKGSRLRKLYATCLDKLKNE